MKINFIHLEKILQESKKLFTHIDLFFYQLSRHKLKTEMIKNNLSEVSLLLKKMSFDAVTFAQPNFLGDMESRYYQLITQESTCQGLENVLQAVTIHELKIQENMSSVQALYPKLSALHAIGLAQRVNPENSSKFYPEILKNIECIRLAEKELAENQHKITHAQEKLHKHIFHLSLKEKEIIKLSNSMRKEIRVYEKILNEIFRGEKQSVKSVDRDYVVIKEKYKIVLDKIHQIKQEKSLLNENLIVLENKEKLGDYYKKAFKNLLDSFSTQQESLLNTSRDKKKYQEEILYFKKMAEVSKSVKSFLDNISNHLTYCSFLKKLVRNKVERIAADQENFQLKQETVSSDSVSDSSSISGYKSVEGGNYSSPIPSADNSDCKSQLRRKSDNKKIKRVASILSWETYHQQQMEIRKHQEILKQSEKLCKKSFLKTWWNKFKEWCDEITDHVGKWFVAPISITNIISPLSDEALKKSVSHGPFSYTTLLTKIKRDSNSRGDSVIDSIQEAESEGYVSEDFVSENAVFSSRQEKCRSENSGAYSLGLRCN